MASNACWSQLVSEHFFPYWFSFENWFLVIFIQVLVWLQHILKNNHRIIYEKVISSILQSHFMIEVESPLKLNEQHLLDLLKKKW